MPLLMLSCGPSCLGTLAQLTSLTLCYNPGTTASRLAATLACCTGLQEIRIQEHCLRLGHASCVPLLKACSQLTRLSLLDLTSNCLGVGPDVRRAAVLLAQVQSLVKLSLSANQLEDAHMQELAPRLAQLPCLQCLDMSMNELGDEGLRALLTAFAASSTLRMLSVCEMESPSDAAYAAFEWLRPDISLIGVIW